MIVRLAATDSLFANPEFWVAMSFVAFLALLVYYGVPAMLGRALDSRAERIRKELDEARRLREEAQQLLADYKRKAAKAEDEARAIVDNAQQEAQALAAETRKALQDTLERRTRMAEEKIERAEAQAVSEVRAAAIERAVGAAERIIRARVDGDQGDVLITDAIAKLPAKLN
ncbi:MAG: F0F1 ATP synthase subunit B [Pseudomonadota bacterium]